MPGKMMTFLRLKEGALPVDNITKFAWDEGDYEEVQEWHEYEPWEIEQLALAAKAKGDRQKLDLLLGLMRQEEVPSDKVGYRFLNTYIGDLLISQEYIEGDTSGTEGNPIEWEPGCQAIPNAYYSYNEQIYIYMGSAGLAAEEFDTAVFILKDW